MLRQTPFCACSRSLRVMPLGCRPSLAAHTKQYSQVEQELPLSGRYAAGQQQQQPAARHVCRALKDEDAEIDRIAREAAQTDIWGNEVVGTLVKVGVVAAVLGVVVLISSLGRPMFDNTIKSFPTPTEYEQYEQRELDEGY